MRIDWKFRRYWINGKTRMYILENTGRTPLLSVANFHCFNSHDFGFINCFLSLNVTGDMVNHYKLCMGDYLGLYKDELTNLVSITSFYKSY